MTNGTLIQFFHWYIPDDGSLWNHLKEEADHLASLGFNAVWLPPAQKGVDGSKSVGYDVYDIYDLGEFDQKGSVRTKYGTKDQLVEAVKTVQSKGLQVYADIVVNHMGGAVGKEKIKVRKVDPNERNRYISDEFEIEAYTKFSFPCRKDKYSGFKWDHHCFTGVDHAADTGESAIFQIMNEYEGWEDVVDEEIGNYDFLMFCDIEFRNPAVREELKRWGKWYQETIGFDGVRLDAVKHIAPQFYNEWLDYMRAEVKPGLFAVGEYWAPGDVTLLKKYLDAVDGRMSLFDAPLHRNLHRASKTGKDFDLTTVFNSTLVGDAPTFAVTVVDNHDTQPLQALEAPVEAWFKPIAYALILLREAGYPTVFYPDLYGGHYKDYGRDGSEYEIWLEKCEDLEKLLLARKQFAYGLQRDYFDHPNCIGWTREGTEDIEHSGCAVIISNSEAGFKEMEMGDTFKGKVFVDYLQKHTDEVTIGDNGRGIFPVVPGSVCVWIVKEAIS